MIPSTRNTKYYHSHKPVQFPFPSNPELLPLEQLASIYAYYCQQMFWIRLFRIARVHKLWPTFASESTYHAGIQWTQHEKFLVQHTEENVRRKQQSWSQLEFAFTHAGLLCVHCGGTVHSRPAFLQHLRMKRFRNFLRNCGCLLMHYLLTCCTFII